MPEKVEQAHGVQLLHTLGAKVYVLGTRRRRGDHQGTMQTEGLPDVLAFLPRRLEHARRIVLVWECKGEGGRLRPEQREFQDLCLEADVPHLVGNFDMLIAWLTARGYVKTEQFPHYRQATEVAPT